MYFAVGMLNRHVKLVHEKNTEKTIKCELCDRVYKNVENYETHLLGRKHAEKLGEEALAELESKT